MTAKSNYKRTADWLAACGKSPENPKDLSCQIGVHLEEVVELLRTIEIDNMILFNGLQDAAGDLEAIGNVLKKGNAVATIPVEWRIEALDALCDTEVTGNGIAFLAGFNKDAADQEVLRSNESKFENGEPVLLPGGKIGKGPSYTAPNLEDFV